MNAKYAWFAGAALMSVSVVLYSAPSAQSAAAQTGKAVKINRLYTGPDGQTHAEDIEVKFGPGGTDPFKLMAGAGEMLHAIRKGKGVGNPGLLLACLQHHFDTLKGKPMVVMLPYANRLFRFADWYRQLLAESIGKNPKTGPTPINALGTTDQHSQLQLYNEGPDNKWFIFMEALKPGADQKLGKNLPKEIGFLNGRSLDTILKASLQGTVGSLTKNGRPNITLKLDRIDEGVIGGLLMLFEFQVALLGLLYKVNAFDQPGVEQSKSITKKILSSEKK